MASCCPHPGGGEVGAGFGQLWPLFALPVVAKRFVPSLDKPPKDQMPDWSASVTTPVAPDGLSSGTPMTQPWSMVPSESGQSPEWPP